MILMQLLIYDLFILTTNCIILYNAGKCNLLRIKYVN